MDLFERLRMAIRAFKVGQAVVDPYAETYGHDDSTYGPEEYGNYLVTSNAVFTCANLRADSLAGVKLKAYKMVKGKKEEVKDGDVTQLLKKVNDYWTMNRLMKMSELSLCLWGRNFWAVERGANGKGKPQEIWWMKPTQVKVHPDPVNYIKGFEYRSNFGGEPIWFDPWEVVWFREPNPLDEFGGLSPIAAARLAADLASGAAKSNKFLFDQGYQPGGVVTPNKGVTLTKEQAEELERKLDKRFKGVDKAHRWGVFRFEAEMKSMSVTPKDAEFLGTLEWSLEEVARAYGVPLDMIGGQRTYENVKASDRAFWMRTMFPECGFFASEIVEQLLPMFGSNKPDLVEFDLKNVPALMDDEKETWEREKGQIEVGAITVNEWRDDKGLESVEWGDERYMPRPVTGDGGRGMIKQGTGDGGRGMPGRNDRGVEVGSEEHERLWRRYERRTKKWEKRVGKEVKELFERQRESVLAKMKKNEKTPTPALPLKVEGEKKGGNGNYRTMEEAAKDPFKMAEWVKKFRIAMRILLVDLIGDFGQDAIDELDLLMLFDVNKPEVMRFIEKQTQRFAVEVNETTWNKLRASLSEGMEEGEALPKMIKRVEDVMGERIRSSGETIARTEVNAAANGGTLKAWEQSGVVKKKSWLSALQPGRTRDTHVEAHVRYQAEPIGLKENFQVGAGSGPHPGAIGLAEEDINCLCTLVPVVE